MKLSNWGNYPVVDADLVRFDEPGELHNLFNGAKGGAIARGMGRCYGDSALAKTVIDTRSFNHFLGFDGEEGILTCEAGVTFEEILEALLPRGWFLPVTPGTKFVTVGGAVASDVHGKNHHLSGSLSAHVLSLDLMLPDGAEITCSPTENAELFDATVGGMGLTGVILRATIKMQRVESAYIRQETVKAKNLDHIIDLFEESKAWTYSVAWIDCLAKGESRGRSILMRGEHAVRAELPASLQADPLRPKPKKKKNIPFYFPSFALNPLSVKAFNALYYGRAPAGVHRSMIDYDTFFYPLDAIHNWNRIYGKRGFTQYQFVLPLEHSKEGMHKILEAIGESGQGSFLAVLKMFGPQKEGLLHFPMEGLNLALDFAVTPKLFALLDRLDALVKQYGGRLYLTKDARMDKTMFNAGYGEAASRFRELRKKLDPEGKLASLQSQRIGL